MAEVRLTPEGVAKYEKRLEFLKTTARTDIAEQIKIARSFGDLSENAEYDAAKQEQARIEYEIAEIETMLRNVVLIDEDSIDTALANVGTQVCVRDLETGKELTFRIVGSAEANPALSSISNESPVGKGLLGHKARDVVEIATPRGVIRYEVLSIGK